MSQVGSLRLWLHRLENWAVVRLSPRHWRRQHARAALAARYLAGTGLEIGALHTPLLLPPGARVRYLDYLPVAGLRQAYPDLAWLPIVSVDIVDDGETLVSVPDGGADFLVANHVIEHCENPLQTLSQWLRVVAPGGILFVAVPDMLRTFDRNRLLTPVEHLIRDYRQGPESSRSEHERELGPLGPSHPHYHVWTLASFAAMLEAARTGLGLEFAVEELRYLDAEFVAVLRKLG